MKKVIFFALLFIQLGLLESSAPAIVNLDTLRLDKFKDLFLQAVKGKDENLLQRIIASKNFQNITSHILGIALINAVMSNSENIVKIIIKSSRFKDISDQHVKSALDIAVENKYAGSANLIMAALNSGKGIATSDLQVESKSYQEASDLLGKRLLHAVENKDEALAQQIINDKDFKHISTEILNQAFVNAIKTNQVNIIKLFMNTAKFNNISHSNLYLLLIWGIENNHEDIVRMMINHREIKHHLNEFEAPAIFKAAIKKDEKNIQKIVVPNLNFIKESSDVIEFLLIESIKKDEEEIIKLVLSNASLKFTWDNYLKHILFHAAKNGHENIVRFIMKDPTSRLNITTVDLDKALNVATENGHKGCANWIRAYTALKPENELGELNPFENAVWQAYQEMLKGNPNDLRNLLLPIGKKGTSDIYAVAPKADAETQAFTIIDNALFKLFKRDHIIPLLLSLVENERQKKAAFEQLRFMGLIAKR